MRHSQSELYGYKEHTYTWTQHTVESWQQIWFVMSKNNGTISLLMLHIWWILYKTAHTSNQNGEWSLGNFRNYGRIHFEISLRGFNRPNTYGQNDKDTHFVYSCTHFVYSLCTILLCFTVSDTLHGPISKWHYCHLSQPFINHDTILPLHCK
jgi:hypothetical protein